MSNTYIATVGASELSEASDEGQRYFNICYLLASLGYHFRSGAAPGADTIAEKAFRKAVENNKTTHDKMEVIIPWVGFPKDPSSPWAKFHIVPTPKDLSLSKQIAAKVHPNWTACKEIAMKFLARDVNQFLGMTLDVPAKAVLCFTFDGAETEAQCSRETGGTHMCIRLADRYKVPVFNLYHKDAEERILKYLGIDMVVTKPPIVSLVPKCDVYFSDIKIQNTEHHLKALTEQVAWEYKTSRLRGVKMYGKPYRYSGIVVPASPWRPAILALMEKINKHHGFTMNSCLLNYYKNGSVGIAKHSDNERELIGGADKCIVVSASLGATRNFILQDKITNERFIIPLKDGDILIMGPGTQKYYEHSINSQLGVAGSRISMTFREFE